MTELLSSQHDVHAVVRSLDKNTSVLARAFQTFSVGDIKVDTDWTATLAGLDCVVHCAARAHVMNETKTDAIVAHRAVNVAGPCQLAEQAAKMDVRRLVYLNSINVNGEQTACGDNFSFLKLIYQKSLLHFKMAGRKGSKCSIRKNRLGGGNYTPSYNLWGRCKRKLLIHASLAKSQGVDSSGRKPKST